MHVDNLVEDMKSLAEQYGDEPCPVCGHNHKKQYETIMKDGMTVGHAMGSMLDHDLQAILRESWPLCDYGQPEFSDMVFE